MTRAPRHIQSLTERLDTKTRKTESCWVWTGAAGSSGYGCIAYQGQTRYAHRLAYEAHIGPIPEGLSIDHICHTKLCVRPDHLRLADKKRNAENLRAPYSNNKTGVRGVYQCKRGLYQAQITHEGKTKHLGAFTNLADAEVAVLRARIELFTFNDADKSRAKEILK